MALFTSHVRALLDEEGIPYRLVEGDLIVVLPSGFGELFVGDLPEGDTIIGLVGYLWHTHGDIEESLTGLSAASAAMWLIRGILSGEHWMVEVTSPTGEIEKWIEVSYPSVCERESVEGGLLPGYSIRIVQVDRPS